VTQEFKNIKGFSELDKALREIPEKLARNVMRSGLRAGAVVFRDESKVNLASNGSIQSGELRDGLKVGTNFRNGVARAYVKIKGKHAFLAPWIEYGTAAHSIAARNVKYLFFGGAFVNSVEHPGAKPKPFMRPALESKTQEALQAVGDVVKAKLTKQGIETPDVVVGDEEEE
jgi:HK97 gp10 family phage protein